jgi:regulator of protease activity HflC (stomatin/prohibitin superfamily)
MHRIYKLLAVTALALLMVACGSNYQADNGQAVAVIDPGSSEIGKFKDGPVGGKIHFPFGCWIEPCDYVAIVDHATRTTEINGSYWISASDVALELNLAVTYRTAPNRDARLAALKLGAVRSNGDVKYYGGENVFHTYVAKRAPDAIREILNTSVDDGKDGKTPMTIEILMDNFETISPMLTKAVRAFAKDSAIEIVDVRIQSIGWPEEIKQAKLRVRMEDEERKRKLKAADARLEVIKKNRTVDIQAARIALEVDRVIAGQLDAQMATWHYLETIRLCAENEKGCSMIAIPPGMAAGSSGTDIPVLRVR